jgi:hypothetical protein
MRVLIQGGMGGLSMWRSGLGDDWSLYKTARDYSVGRLSGGKTIALYKTARLFHGRGRRALRRSSGQAGVMLPHYLHAWNIPMWDRA